MVLIMQVTVHYFALMREQSGVREEVVETTAATPAELLGELAERHPFSIEQDRLRVVVNEEFAPWTHPIANGDEIAFIPPVAGG